MRNSTGATGAAAPTANKSAAASARRKPRLCTTAMTKTSGTAATSSKPTACRVASDSPPARPARAARPIVGRSKKRAPASSIAVKKKRKSGSVRTWLLVTISVTDSAARMPAISPTSGEMSAPSAAMSAQVPASITELISATARGASPNVLWTPATSRGKSGIRSVMNERFAQNVAGSASNAPRSQ